MRNLLIYGLGRRHRPLHRHQGHRNFSDPKYFHPRPSAAGNGYDPTSSGGSNLGPTSAKFLNGTTKQPAPPTPAAGTTDPAATAPATAAPAPPLPLVVDNDGIQLRVLHYCDDNGIALLAMRDGMMVDLTPFKTSDGWDEVKLITAFNDADHPLTVKASAMIPVDAVTASASGLDPHISMANAMLQLARVAKARGFKEEVIGRMVLMAIDGRERLFGEPGINVLRLNLALDAVR
jgi:K+-transporting ATPase ATPase C chain